MTNRPDPEEGQAGDEAQKTEGAPATGDGAEGGGETDEGGDKGGDAAE